MKVNWKLVLTWRSINSPESGVPVDETPGDVLSSDSRVIRARRQTQDATRVVQRLHDARLQRVDVRLLGRNLGQTRRVVRQVGHVLVLGVAAKRLQKHPEEVGEDARSGRARALLIRRHVEDEGDAASERDHDDGERHQEEHDVLHHVIHAQDDRAKVLWRDADLNKAFVHCPRTENVN